MNLRSPSLLRREQGLRTDQVRLERRLRAGAAPARRPHGRHRAQDRLRLAGLEPRHLRLPPLQDPLRRLPARQLQGQRRVQEDILRREQPLLLHGELEQQYFHFIGG